MSSAPFDENTEASLRSLLLDVEGRLGIPAGYIYSMRSSTSDWEFVVKLALVIEATLTQAIVSSLHTQSVFAHFSKINQATRIKVAREMGLLGDEDSGVLWAISEVRNTYVHRVENINRSLEEYALDLVDGRFNLLIAKLYKTDQKAAHKLDVGPEKFRDAMFTQALFPLIHLAYKGKNADSERMQISAARQISSHFSLGFSSTEFGTPSVEGGGLLGMFDQK